MSVYKQIAEEIGQIVTDKNAAYGSSFAKAGEFLKLLYPHGLSVDEFETALLLVRIFDKQMRLATDADAFGESPFLDIAGYGILGVSLHHARKEAAAVAPSQEPVTANQEIGRWLERSGSGRCAFCETELVAEVSRYNSTVFWEGRMQCVEFCSQNCADCADSRYAELDGAPQ